MCFKLYQNVFLICNENKQLELKLLKEKDTIINKIMIKFYFLLTKYGATVAQEEEWVAR